MKGYFYLFLGEDSKYYGTLRAANHEPTLQGVGCKTKEEALARIESVQLHSKNPNNFERADAKDGTPMFRLKHEDQILGWSETYSSKQMRDKGIESVITTASIAKIKDVTGEGKKPKTYMIFVNKSRFEVTNTSMTGAEVLALVGYAAPKYCLSFKGDSQNPIGANDSIEIRNGLHFEAVLSDIKFG